MQDLEITWPDGVERFSVADSPIHLGRSSQAAIPLTESSVSRRHLELEWNGTAWLAKDSSTHGTYDPIGVRLAAQWTLSTNTTVRLGGPEGVPVQIRLVGTVPDIDLVADHRGAASTAGTNGTARVAAAPGPIGPPVERLGAPVERPTMQAPAPAPPAARQQVDERPEGGALFAPVDRAEPAESESRPAGDALFPDRRTGQDQPGSYDPETPPGPEGAELRTPSRSAPPPSPSHRAPAKPKILSDGEADATPGPATDTEPGPPARSSPAGASLLGPGPTGGQPAVSIDPNSTIISDSTLRLSVGGQDYSFLPGAEVTVGRDPSCLVQLDERHSLVSRRHLKLTFDKGHWWLEDFSSKGTFVNGQRLKKPYRADGAFLTTLGDDDAGTPMRIITAGDHRAPGNRNTLAIAGLAAAALIPLLILAVLLTRNGGSSNEPDFEAAKRSTVMLFGTEGGQGSGFMVSDDLILTNQHVAVLSPQMLVGVTRQADEPAQIEYATELVANHPFLDLAVLRISNPVATGPEGPEISSEPVGNVNLPAVSIGDSSEVTIGDRVFNTGFPGRLSITSADDAGDLRLPSVVATSGEAANFAIWPGCSNPDLELFIPDESPPGVACSAGGDLRNGVLLASFFSSGQGASGSAVYHENEVVAVVYAGAAEEDNATLSITSAVFADWLSEIIEQNP